MSRFVTIVVSVFAVVSSTAVRAACNPDVVPPECHSYEDLVCGGVTPPGADRVDATADCGGFRFELKGVYGGEETILAVRRWAGAADCPPEEIIDEKTSDLDADISWVVTAGTVSASGSESVAVFSRPPGVCSAKCVFTVTSKPTLCSPSSFEISSSAVFSNAVAITGGGPRVCTTSDSHSPHRFPYSVSCDAGKSTSVSGPAVKVSDDGGVVVVRGTSAGGAVLTVSADCGSDMKPFDVVELDRMTLHGCGCINGDDPAFETMAGKGEVTATLTTSRRRTGRTRWSGLEM